VRGSVSAGALKMSWVFLQGLDTLLVTSSLANLHRVVAIRAPSRSIDFSSDAPSVTLDGPQGGFVRRQFLSVLAVVWALVVPAAAQTAVVSGTIVDQSGAAVPGATVALLGPGGSTTISGSRGEYSFRNVAAGTYRITITLSGFATATRENVVVGSSNVEVPPISLAIASLSDTIVVSASKSTATCCERCLV
jgi:hypothetical protein